MCLTALTVNLVATGVGVAAFPWLGLLSSFAYEHYRWGSLSAARLREYKNAERLAFTDPMATTSARRDVFGSLFSKLT